MVLSSDSAALAITWQSAAFSALSTQQLYAALQLRSEVFVVEQACVFNDIDDADPQAMHVLGMAGSQLVAYARCFATGIKFAEASIGRVVTHKQWRSTGAGYVLMQHAIACVHQQWGVQPIRIGAQAHLEKFYERLGFVKAGQPYIEDGIAHIEMLRP